MLRLPYWQDWPLVVRERKTAVPVPHVSDALTLLADRHTYLVGAVNAEGGERRFAIMVLRLTVALPSIGGVPADALVAACRPSPEALLAETEAVREEESPIEPWLTIVHFVRVPQDSCVFG